MNKVQYWLMDGRAFYDIDKAVVLETCDTYEAAMGSIEDYGDDTCIVRVSGEGLLELIR